MATSSDGGGGRAHVTFSAVPVASPNAQAVGQRKPPTGRGGTRRLGVDPQGQYTYKNTPSSTLMASLQLGLQHSIGSIEPKPHRDILMTDFEVVETAEFSAAGSGSTPGHKYKDFTFKTYSPEAMRFFREAFGILPEDYMLALCDRPLREVSNPGASGSLFYLSADDAFILKTVQKKEARFLQKLLPGYYLNLTQNKRTLLPKFFGLYRYKSGSVNIRIVVMNNLLPSSVRYHEKYDLKGSTYKRKAGTSEQRKRSPTYKDLDFVDRHEEGITLAPEKYEALVHSVERDCKVLESFGIMDYSLLLGIHNIDQAIREKAEAAQGACDTNAVDVPIPSRIELSKNFSIVSTEDIPSLLAEEQQQRHHYPEGYIQGRIHGDRVMFYLGLIDILQSYRLKKKLEHGIKSVITDGTTVSVHNPSFYARRFQDFVATQVFKKDKTKYRTRKNSTNVQLRGRSRPVASTSGGGPSRPLLQGPLDRQTSRDSRTSPLHEPPSYNQAMKGAGVAMSNVRARSLSESISSTTNRGGQRGVPRLPSTAMQIPAVDSGLSIVTTDNVQSPSRTSASSTNATQQSSGVSVSSANATQQSSVASTSTTNVLKLSSGTSLATNDAVQLSSGTDGSFKTVPSSTDMLQKQIAPLGGPPASRGNVKEEVASVKLQEPSEVGGHEFARHVRGTSTPIDVSPSATPNQSHTFNADLTAVVTEPQEVAGREGGFESDSRGKRRSSLKREDAVESPSGMDGSETFDISS